MKHIIPAIFALSSMVNAASACGADTDCGVGSRTYRIALPDTVDASAPLGALVYAHGFGGSAQGTMNNANLRAVANDLGIAFVALQSTETGWELPFSPRAYDSDGSAEFRYVDDVLDDISAAHSVNLDRVMMAGFSAGGMMTWNLACRRSDRFVGFVPMSGTFWLNVPTDCDVPASSVFHFHGDADTVVPLEGRQIRNTHQGSIPETIDMYVNLGDFGASKDVDLGGADCDLRINPEGLELAFCMFSGGHSFRTDFLRAAWEKVGEG